MINVMQTFYFISTVHLHLTPSHIGRLLHVIHGNMQPVGAACTATHRVSSRVHELMARARGLAGLSNVSARHSVAMRMAIVITGS